MAYEDSFAAVPGVSVEWIHYVDGTLICKIQVEGDNNPRYILDVYGSCPDCDAYAAELDGSMLQEDLAAFGQSYVEAALTFEEVLSELLPKPGKYYPFEIRECLEKVLEDYPEKAALLKAEPLGSA